jgi:hypothetical protein
MTITSSTPITSSIPSISSSAMLVELSISEWSGRKQDKRASEDVARANHAQLNTATVSKKLLGDCAELDAVKKLSAAIRQFHYSCTLPWSDTGLRIIRTTAYFKYHQQMTALMQEWKRLLDVFLGVYDWEITQAQAKLGNLFSRDEYPDTESIRSKFAFRLNYIPLPESGDFRIDIGNEGQAELKAQLQKHYEEYYARNVNDAVASVWGKLIATLKHASERLDDAEVGQEAGAGAGAKSRKNKAGGKIFRDSMLEKVMEAIDGLEANNITGDPGMVQTHKQLTHLMRGITSEALREDAHLRRETKQAIDDVLSKLNF